LCVVCEVVSFLSVLSLAAVRICADEVMLASGGRIQGEVISKDDRQLVMQTAYGRVTFEIADISQITYSTPLEKQLKMQLSALASSEVAARLQLAAAAAAGGLKDLASSIYTQVIAIDPNEKTARKALGYIFYEEEWVTQRDKELHPGLVPYRGQWVRAEERAVLRQNDAERAYYADFGLAPAEGEKLVDSISDIGLEILPRGGYIVRRHLQTWPVKEKPYFYSMDVLNWQRLGVFIGVTFLDGTRRKLDGFGKLDYTIYSVETDAVGNAKIGKEIYSAAVDIRPEMYGRQSDFKYWDTKINSTYEQVTSDNARAAWAENNYMNCEGVMYVLANPDMELLAPPGVYYVEATFTLKNTVKKAGRFVQYAQLR